MPEYEKLRDEMEAFQIEVDRQSSSEQAKLNP